MESLRTYGEPPFRVAVVHGGPGAPGGMAPVARALSSRRGVLEPLQAAKSLDGQVEELRAVLERSADLPATLIGSSWGAWLSFITAARHPALVAKLVLVGSGPFEESYAASILPTRLSRLAEAERREVEALFAAVGDPALDKDVRDRSLARIGGLLGGTDAYDPLPDESTEPPLPGQADVYESVWRDASELRRSGRLLDLAREVRCPVLAIHGDHDPHPAEGVRLPLSRALADLRFVLLERCGHEPWRERQARERFYEVLEEALAQSTKGA